MERVLRQQPLGLRAHVGVLAQREPGLEQGGDRSVADLGQPATLRVGERGVRPVAVGLAPPQVDSGAEQPRGLDLVSGRETGPAASGEVGQTQGVDVLTPGLECVAGAPTDDVPPGRARRPVRLQGAAQVHQVRLEGLAGGGRTTAVPEMLDDPVGAHHPWQTRHEHGEEQAFLGARHHHRHAVVTPDLERPQDRDVHAGTVGAIGTGHTRLPRAETGPATDAGRTAAAGFTRDRCRSPRTPAPAGTGSTRRGSGRDRRPSTPPGASPRGQRSTAGRFDRR